MFYEYSPIEILLVEDNPGDVRLTIEGFKESRINNNLNVVNDGEQALDYLFKRGDYAKAKRPDLILLDLNLPKIDGREVLKKIKEDATLKLIPVVILTTSQADKDINSSYENYANCYISKPVDFDQFVNVVKSIKDFWMTIVKLPKE
ncbi:MAG TPA: response regulator [Candidatus Methanofastidiosa archaeon]|nr:response regulator [Candidatus Methanofastidiosa archaeon]HPR42527.1 response regulator [Candidatus Methanofastidiosa archaeon]